MLVVRRFDNADLPTVVRLWNLHHQESGLAFPISMAQFEAAVLDRLTGPSDQILIGEVGDHAVGFVHVAAGLSGDTGHEHDMLSETDPRHLVALCVEPSALATQTANTLIRAAESIGAVVAGISIQHRAGYIGLTPLSGLAGVADSDSRTAQWLLAAGWEATQRWGVWQLALSTFRIPVDRRLSALRRSSSLAEAPRTASGFRQESGWGHLDPLTFELRDRSGKAFARVTAWHAGFGDVITGSEVILTDLTMLPGAPDGSDLQLMAETLRDLASRRFLSVKIAIRSDQSVEQAFWQTMGFRNMGSGAIYNKLSFD